MIRAGSTDSQRTCEPASWRPDCPISWLGFEERSEQLEEAVQLGVGVVEVGGEAEVVPPLAVGTERGDDAGGLELLVERGEVGGAGPVKGNDAAGVFGPVRGIEHLAAFRLQGGHE